MTTPFSPPSPKAQSFLTGITTTGTPHLGNYVGSIRPSVAASAGENACSFYFLADHHALVKCAEPERIARSTLEIAASWLAAGLNPDRVTFYRQSDIPEIPELMWLLTCVCGKGMLNRAHAYKAAVDKNQAAGQDPDADINAGLFMYPVLMAADILLFKAGQVPVGRDQVQHIEMARDMAQRFNHLYGEHLVLPEALVEESVALLPGLDGRKMSKSYDNTIALFAPRATLQKQIASIVTDSRAPGEPKESAGSAVFQIYQAFASAPETEELQRAFADGIAWGEAKAILFERIDKEVAPMRAKYETLLREPETIEQILLAGAEKARATAVPVMQALRAAVGLARLTHSHVPQAKQGKRAGAAASSSAQNSNPELPTFKQYRESNGQFFFKMFSEHGKLLLLGGGYASPKAAAEQIALLRQGIAPDQEGNLQVQRPPEASSQELADALMALAADLEDPA